MVMGCLCRGQHAIVLLALLLSCGFSICIPFLIQVRAAGREHLDLERHTVAGVAKNVASQLRASLSAQESCAEAAYLALEFSSVNASFILGNAPRLQDRLGPKLLERFPIDVIQLHPQFIISDSFPEGIGQTLGINISSYLTNHIVAPVSQFVFRPNEGLAFLAGARLVLRNTSDPNEPTGMPQLSNDGIRYWGAVTCLTLIDNFFSASGVDHEVLQRQLDMIVEEVSPTSTSVLRAYVDGKPSPVVKRLDSPAIEYVELARARVRISVAPAAGWGEAGFTKTHYIEIVGVTALCVCVLFAIYAIAEFRKHLADGQAAVAILKIVEFKPWSAQTLKGHPLFTTLNTATVIMDGLKAYVPLSTLVDEFNREDEESDPPQGRFPGSPTMSSASYVSRTHTIPRSSSSLKNHAIPVSNSTLERKKSALSTSSVPGFAEVIPFAEMNQTLASLVVFNLAGFSNKVKALGMEEVGKFHELYVEIVNAICRENGGIVNTFQGDSFLVSFNALKKCSQSTAAACRSALSVMGQVKAISSRSPSAWQCRCAITTGRVFFGTFGCSQMRSRTMVGPAVRNAFILERANKLNSTSILVDQATQRRGESNFAFRFVDCIALHPESSEHVTNEEDYLCCYELLKLVSQDTEDKEWMYRLLAVEAVATESEHFTKCMRHLIEKDYGQALVSLQNVKCQDTVTASLRNRIDELKNGNLSDFVAFPRKIVPF